jgi:hypothetical protein
MRRITVVLLVATMVAALTALPAAAGVDHNPNLGEAADLTCENGLESDVLLTIGRVGRTPSGVSGVATAVHVLAGPGGPIVQTHLDVPGSGLDRNTTWCEWFDPELGIWLGGEILLRGDLR